MQSGLKAACIILRAFSSIVHVVSVEGRYNLAVIHIIVSQHSLPTLRYTIAQTGNWNCSSTGETTSVYKSALSVVGRRITEDQMRRRRQAKEQHFCTCKFTEYPVGPQKQGNFKYM